jgi:regulator of protease activity HflC (stomatin/prohibitin superfamily)
MTNSSEKPVPFKMSGWVAVFIAIAVLIYGLYCVFPFFKPKVDFMDILFPILWRAGLTLFIFFSMLSGLNTLQKNTATVYTFLGNYVGTLRGPGFFWVPFWFSAHSNRDLSTQTISIAEITVNEKSGKPILIGCDIFCSEEDTHKATFDISSLKKYLPSKGEVALRKVAQNHPMDAADNVISLRGSIDEVTKDLEEKITTEFEKAGYKVDSAAITKLTYVPEIAGAMLQKQQAASVVEARKTIVEGALGIVEDALKSLDKDEKTKLVGVERNRFATNLLLVLCSHEAVSPVMNVGGKN